MEYHKDLSYVHCYFHYTCCPLVILLENTGFISIVMLMTLNYISQQDQMKLLNYLSSTIKNLGVILDSKLFFENHISHVIKTAFFHLRNIAKLRNMLSVSDAEKLVHAFMTSRLDYCNALQGGCPASLINKLQIVQNAAARVLIRLRKYDHITPILQSLHRLPIKFHISYKILLLDYKALNYLAPCCIFIPVRNPKNLHITSQSSPSNKTVIKPLYYPLSGWR